MMELTQRDPRQRDDAFLAFVRKQPCCVCGKPGPSDAAHIRAGNPMLGKRYCGKGEKPHDRYATPLCRHHHEQQHSMAEMVFWEMVMLNPFKIAHDLYQVGAGTVTTRKQRSQSRFVGSRKIQQGKTVWAKRELKSRNDLRRRPMEAAQ